MAHVSVEVLLVTKDFLASSFINEHELAPVLKGAEIDGVKILWVLIRACAYSQTPLKRYQSVVFNLRVGLAEMSHIA